MSKNSSAEHLTVVGIKPESLALFEGVLAMVIGLFIAILFALRTTINLTQETNSLLSGLTFGLGAGIVMDSN